MSRTIYCQKLKKDAEGLAMPPYPGPLGQKIYDQISAEGWQLWLNHQTMMINEKRLSLADPDTRKYLAEEMEKFLFGGDYDKPEGYTPPESS